MTLYEIAKTINDIIENSFSVDEETGEILFDETDLEKLNNDKDTKIENIACFIKNLNAEADMIRAEEKNLADRRRAKERKAENLKNYLSTYMNIVMLDKFESPRTKISFRKSESIEVLDLNVIPADFLRYKDPEVNKTEVKKALKNGIEIAGCQLVENKSIQIK